MYVTVKCLFIYLHVSNIVGQNARELQVEAPLLPGPTALVT